MALYLSTTIRLHRQTSVSQHSIHTPPICLINVCAFVCLLVCAKKKINGNLEKERAEDRRINVAADTEFSLCIYENGAN